MGIYLGWRRHRIPAFDYKGIHVEDEGEVVVMPGQVGNLTIMSCQQPQHKSPSMKEVQPTYLPFLTLPMLSVGIS